MIQELQTGILDINNKYNIDFSCKQLDDIILKIIVYDKSLPADLSDYTCRLKAFKADQVPLIQNTNISIKDNVVTIKASNQLTTTAGILKAELQFVNKTTLEKKSSFFLEIEVVASVLSVDSGISTPTCTILEEIDHKLDEIENIGRVLDEAKDVRDTLQNTTIPTGSSINSKLEANINNADAKIIEVNNIISSATSKIEEVEISVNNANASKKEIDDSKIEADTTKIELDKSNVQAEKNIEELNKIGDAKDLAAKVETNKNNTEDLQEKVEDNTSQLKDCAKNINNLNDNKIELKKVKNIQCDILCTYGEFIVENIFDGKVATGEQNYSLGYPKEPGFLSLTVKPNMINCIANGVSYIATFRDSGHTFIKYQLNGTASKWKQLATTEITEIGLLNGARTYLDDPYYAPYCIKTGILAIVTGNIKVSGIPDDTVIMGLPRPGGHKWIKVFTNNGTPISFYLAPSGELKIRGASSVDANDNLPLDFSYRL